MKYADFLKLIKTYQQLYNNFNELYAIGFDFTDGKYKLEPDMDFLFQTILSAYYTEEGIDWINWFIYENEFGKKDWSKLNVYDMNGTVIPDADAAKAYGACDKDGNPICHTIKATWKYVEQFKKN
ncbi:MAG: hypothetical protein COU25_00010 [Candidatus Levybacteria bacterium CG10_big_fil_rev_8_21_14_0_10_35_13]|nr:MAG: hypothetical protein COU25_00010 [Candidatus Levybacteria bacterium CG10_big_fil_rev_8_21_14_0_10_35_13]